MESQPQNTELGIASPIYFQLIKQLLPLKLEIAIIWALSRQNLSSGFANNKGADQPAHPRRLISVYVIRLQESIVSQFDHAKFQYSN